MNEIWQLLRESLPEAIGALIAAGVLALVAWIWARRRKPPVLPPPTPPEPARPIPQPPRRREPRFIDRHDHEGRDLVERVSEALGGNGLVTVWGSGGVGKTTLAIEVAHCLCPSPYSGGVIWDTADGRADFTLVNLLDKILTDLEREEARTLAPDAKVALADRLLTEAMPCLLGLDNFETIAPAEQQALIDFLDELSCPVLVTSRESLRIGQNIRVGRMTPAEARQFLELRIEQSSQPDKLREIDFDKIAEVAERNPMLMRWVVAQLEQAMRPQDVFEDIARGRGEATDRIFGRTFLLLDEDGQTALLALALFRPTASREALAAACGFEDGKDRVNEAIRRLAAFDLLDTAVEGDRLGIVALTRRLTQAQLRKDKRTGPLLGRFVFHFVEYALAHPEVTKEDLDALDNERENLLAALDYAYAAEHWESVIRLAGEICPPVTGLLVVRGYWDEAIKWGERAADAARQANFPANVAVYLGNVSAIRLRRGDYGQAREAYEKALFFFKEGGDERNIAGALHQLGIIAQLQGDYQQARDLCNQSLEIKRNLGDQSGIASSLHQLGMIAQDQGDYQMAKNLYNQSLEIMRILGDQRGIAFSLLQLSTIAQDQGRYHEAEQLCNQSLEIKRNLGDQSGIASSLHQLGIIAQKQGDYQEAKDLYNQSLEIKRNLGDQRGIAISLHQLGMIAQKQGDYQEAKDLYNQSLEIAKQLGDQAGMASALHQLGIIAQLQGHYQDAETLYKQSLEIKRNLRDQAGIAISLGQLGTLAEETGQVDQATQRYREALAIFERIGAPEAEMARRDLARVTGKQPKE